MGWKFWENESFKAFFHRARRKDRQKRAERIETSVLPESTGVQTAQPTTDSAKPAISLRTQTEQSTSNSSQEISGSSDLVSTDPNAPPKKPKKKPPKLNLGGSKSPKSPAASTASRTTQSQLQALQDSERPSIFHPLDDRWQNLGNPGGRGRTAERFVKQEAVYFKEGTYEAARGFLALNFINTFCEQIDHPKLAPTCKLSYTQSTPQRYGMVMNEVDNALHYDDIFGERTKVDPSIRTEAQKALPQLIPAIACDVVLAANDRANTGNYVYSTTKRQWFVLDYDSCLNKKPGDKGFAGNAEDVHNLGERPYPQEMREMLEAHAHEFQTRIDRLKGRDNQDMHQLALGVSSIYYPDDLDNAYERSGSHRSDLGNPELETQVVEQNAKTFYEFLNYRTRSENLDRLVGAAHLTSDERTPSTIRPAPSLDGRFSAERPRSAPQPPQDLASSPPTHRRALSVRGPGVGGTHLSPTRNAGLTEGPGR